MSMVFMSPHWNGEQWYPMDCNPFCGMLIDTILRQGNGGSGKETKESRGIFTTMPAASPINRR